MNQRHALLLGALALATLAQPACHLADVDALQDHMVRDCWVAPLQPACATNPGSEDSERLVFVRFAARSVTTSDTERCILDVDCSDRRKDEDYDGVLDELSACIAADPGSRAIAEQRESRDADCVAACDFDLQDCGGYELGACGVDVVAECFAEHDACIVAC